MKLCAVICELNPFHNGHEYLLKTAVRNSGCDGILCVMSGNFVQRAEPAIIDKHSRTIAALHCGASIVVELPVVYATASADLFAKGAIDIITQFSAVTHLAFGCEDDDLTLLKTLSDIAANECGSFKSLLQSNLKSGYSYAKSYAISLSIEAEKHGFDSTMCDRVLSKPNNLLAIEYLKHLNKLQSNIEPLPVKRLGGGYNDKNFHNNFSSASAIREIIYSGDLKKIEGNIPPVMYEYLLQKKEHIPNLDIFNTLALNSLRLNDLGDLLDAGEGVELKLKTNSLLHTDLNEVLKATKSKRYTFAKLKRLCLQSLLNIEKTLPKTPIKLLGIKEELKSKIKAFPPLIIKNSDHDNLDEKYREIEKTAALVYNLITKTAGDGLFDKKLITV